MNWDGAHILRHCGKSVYNRDGSRRAWYRNSEGFGGYLIFRGIPTLIDGRAELYGNAFLARYLAAETGDNSALAALLERYRIRWTLLMPQQGAVRCLDNLPSWRRAYSDSRAVIHIRKS